MTISELTSNKKVSDPIYICETMIHETQFERCGLNESLILARQKGRVELGGGDVTVLKRHQNMPF